MAEGCTGITISAQASYGNQGTPLYEAGEKNISCVVEMEQLGQIQISKAVFSTSPGEQTKQCSYRGVNLSDCIYGYQVSASSGQAYFVETMTAQGKSNQ